MSAPVPMILVADDQAGQRAVVEMLLSLDGYDLACVEDGREALGWLRANTPALAILDVNMPHADGLDVCRRMKRVSRLARVPVVILTAMRDDATLRSAREAGAERVIRKPLEGKDLRAIVREILDAQADGGAHPEPE